MKISIIFPFFTSFKFFIFLLKWTISDSYELKIFNEGLKFLINFYVVCVLRPLTVFPLPSQPHGLSGFIWNSPTLFLRLLLRD